jgi:DNA (cytosine-5)-methyltransferase 1
MFKAQFGRAEYSDIAFAITTRIDSAGCFVVIEYEDMNKELYGYGRRRGADGKVERRFLNEYTNSLHGQVGHARENMEVLVAEFLEPIGCAMRGRNPENPSERGRSNGKYKQRIEMGSNISNTITSVQKDSLVAEPNVLTPKRTDFGKQVRKQYESGELDMSRHDMTELEPRTDGVSNTLTSVQKDNLLAEPLCIPQATKQGYIEVPQGAVFDMSYPESTTRRGRVQEGGQVSPTLMAGGEAPCHYEGKESTSYRIRKLTPRECFRLMGVDDKDIDTIQASGVSNSQQYKMAGNSIVVDVLYHLFRKMFTETHSEDRQLTLF